METTDTGMSKRTVLVFLLVAFAAGGGVAIVGAQALSTRASFAAGAELFLTALYGCLLYRRSREALWPGFHPTGSWRALVLLTWAISLLLAILAWLL
jgi:hypothetical protein